MLRVDGDIMHGSGKSRGRAIDVIRQEIENIERRGVSAEARDGPLKNDMQ
jgi:hypothetical protein